MNLPIEGAKQNASLAWADHAGIHSNPESSNHHQALYVTLRYSDTYQPLYSPTPTKTKRTWGRGGGQTASQKQDLELESTARPSKESKHHLKLCENLYVK